MIQQRYTIQEEKYNNVKQVLPKELGHFQLLTPSTDRHCISIEHNYSILHYYNYFQQTISDKITRTNNQGPASTR
jgi:hypothetical protein